MLSTQHWLIPQYFSYPVVHVTIYSYVALVPDLAGISRHFCVSLVRRYTMMRVKALSRTHVLILLGR